MIEKIMRFLQRRSHSLFDVRKINKSPRGLTISSIQSLARGVFVGDETILCRVLGKYKLYADANDLSISPHLIIDGLWELWVAEFVVGAIRPGMVAVDIGANLGYFTLLFADLVGPSGRVFAFEPNPRMHVRMQRSVVANGFEKLVSIHPEALGSGDGPMKLIVPEGHPGGGYVRALDDNTVPTGDLVKVRRLDSFPEIADADFIKIDAEAAEQDIWRGMNGIFARGKPLTILLEFSSCRYPDPAQFIDEILKEDFSLQYIHHQKGIICISRDDIIALPPSAELMLVLRR